MIKAGFQCQKCKLKVMDVEVRERRLLEDIVNYVHYIGRMCGQRHSIMSPVCSKRELDIYIPMSKNGIGIDGPELDEEDKRKMDLQLKKGKKK
jgi:hypothetical protein